MDSVLQQPAAEPLSTIHSCAYCELPVSGRVHCQPDEPVYCCYGCRFAALVAASSGSAARLNWMITRLGLSIFLSMGVMVFTLYLYSQELYGAGDTLSVAQAELSSLMRYCSMIFAAPVLLLLGVPIATNAWDQLRHGQLSTDSLIVMGVAAAFAYSYTTTLSGQGDTYFETTCMILILVTVGRWLEASHRHNAAETLRKMAALIPERCAVQRDGELVELSTNEVVPGDTVVVRPGERCCVDGVVTAGSAYVDESLISGESAAVVRAVGDSVCAGVVPQDGSLTIEARQVGRHNAVGRFAALLEEARRSRGDFERLADRIASLFIPATGGLAVVGLVLGYQRGGVGEAIMTALAVTLIACPCALGIATPLAVWAAMSRAAARGIVIRGATTLERLARVKQVCFDKTGTLTTGTPKVIGWHCVPQAYHDRLLQAARTAAELSHHAVAQAVVAWTRSVGVASGTHGASSAVGGRGVQTEVDGRTVYLGNEAFLTEQGIDLHATVTDRGGRAQANGQLVCYVAVQDLGSGVFILFESVRTETLDTVNTLKGMGCQAVILTGDASRSAQAIARDCAIDVASGLTPADKITRLQALQQDGAVAMIGDGLNDAPVMAAADVGVAMGCGADLTRDSADACLLSDDLRAVPWLLRLSQQVVRTIRVNLFWAFAYNVIGIGFALSGSLSPILAAGAMVLSSALVVSNSLRGAPHWPAEAVA